MTATAILDKIGNVVSMAVVDGVLFTLSADAVVRVHDLDSGQLVGRTTYPTQAQAKAGCAALVEKARQAVQDENDFLWASGFAED